MEAAQALGGARAELPPHGIGAVAPELGGGAVREGQALAVAVKEGHENHDRSATRPRILFTSSIASTMPGTFQAVYNASKSFALALRAELKDTGVTVTSLMPGPTETEFFERADMLDTTVGTEEKDDPEDVARDGFEALMAGKERAVSHALTTKPQGRFSRLLPDSVKAEMHRRMTRPGSAKE